MAEDCKLLEESRHCWARSVQFRVAASRRCLNEFADSPVSSLSLGSSSQSACLGFNFLVLVVKREKPEVLQNSAEPGLRDLRSFSEGLRRGWREPGSKQPSEWDYRLTCKESWLSSWTVSRRGVLGAGLYWSYPVGAARSNQKFVRGDGAEDVWVSFVWNLLQGAPVQARPLAQHREVPLGRIWLSLSALVTRKHRESKGHLL